MLIVERVSSVGVMNGSSLTLTCVSVSFAVCVGGGCQSSQILGTFVVPTLV